LRQVSLDRTAKTRQLLKMAENAGIILKRLSSKPTFQHFQHLSAIFTSFSHFQLSAYNRKKGEGDMRVG
jgi:hypothetical protein